MQRGTRVDQAAQRLLDRIASGEFADDAPLPPEADLAAELEVSRLTLRESVSILKTQGILRVEHGRGTYVNPMTQWSAIGPFVRATSRADAGATATTPLQLLQIRRMIETGAAELFASVRTDAHLAAMQVEVDRMDAAHAATDVDAFVASDLAFHNVILEGCGNPFVAMLYRPIGRELQAARSQTSAFSAVRVHAQVEHTGILAALRTGDPLQSRVAMESHLRQTIDDLVVHVLSKLT
ncbi:MAG: FadR/GntR family transcriptional regulator [Cellulomonas sp.]